MIANLIARSFQSYGSKTDPNYVQYKSFCREIELAFSNYELEKNPLLEIEQHAPKHPTCLNKLSPNDEELVEMSLEKIADRVSIILSFIQITRASVSDIFLSLE